MLFYDTAGTGCASEVSFNLKTRAVLLHSWSPIEAITTGPLYIHRERGEHCWWKRRGEGEGWMEEGGSVGEEKRVITQTTIFTHFTPSGSVSQGKKKATWLLYWPSLLHKLLRLDFCENSSLSSRTVCSVPRGCMSLTADMVK